ncbi:hypothetical protein GF325_12520 [Candidatus Bathyarchaeota archaeon]|nr:hypothetical protein [Candidatus Bathyarchaeota archaeon]
MVYRNRPAWLLGMLLILSIPPTLVGNMGGEDGFVKSGIGKSSTCIAMEWNRTYAFAGIDECHAIATDSNGATIIAGRSTTPGLGDKNVIAVKYSSSGDFDWKYDWNSGTNEECLGIDVDDQGNVFLAGYTDGLGMGGKDVLIIKLNALGQFQWRTVWGKTGDDQARVTRVSPSGDILVGATSVNVSTGIDLCLLKFNSTGNYTCNRTFGSINEDYCNDLQVDDQGNIFLAGGLNSGTDDDMVVVKYNQTCDFQWHSTWGIPTEDEVATGIVLGSDGSIFLSGWRGDPAGTASLRLVKMDNGGSESWNATDDSIANNTVGAGIAMDAGGDIFIPGLSRNAGNTISWIYLATFNSKGNFTGYETFGGSSTDEGSGVALDDHGNVFLAGTVLESDENMAVCKYDNAAPIITIQRPVAGSRHESNPEYQISLVEFSMDSLWLTINNDTTTHDLPGVVSKIPGDAWAGLDDGMVTYHFHANDSLGHYANASITFEKVPGSMNAFTIGLIIGGAAAAAVVVIAIIIKKRGPDEPKVIEIT